jgi:hypothetical protein
MWQRITLADGRMLTVSTRKTLKTEFTQYSLDGTRVGGAEGSRLHKEYIKTNPQVAPV